MRVITRIVLHTAATARNGKPVHASIGVIRRYHVEHNGWSDIGYHYYIAEDGGVHEGRPVALPGAHVATYNEHTIGICVSGHGDFAPWNDAQMDGVVRLCARLCREHKIPADSVIGHRECDEQSDYDGPTIYKTCPGTRINMEEIRDRVAHELRARPDGLTLEDRVAELEAWRQSIVHGRVVMR